MELQSCPVEMSGKFLQYPRSFIWPLARPGDEDETVIVELRQQTTKILLKTGIGGTASTRGASRGTITSSTKIIGRYVMLMQDTLALCSGHSKAPASGMAVTVEDKSIELLYVDPQETVDDGVVVVTYFLPVIGLVDPEKLKPGDLVGVNMTRTSSWRHFRPSTTRALRRWRWTNGPPSSNRTLAGWTVVLSMPRKDKFKNLGIYPPKGVLHAVDSYLCGANKVDLPEAGRAIASADVHRRRCQARPGRVRTGQGKGAGDYFLHASTLQMHLAVAYALNLPVEH
ncbi:26S protease regulatory subunit 6a [Culex quinquefasciatus]|uniref:26S protease regulatory subunit 6a n=1 Tax=Culex quinquefasciatus TaxID=7176 RepID=B0WUI1_CULQU|nr:26S protease regulatory subunit 6a [Culex quinquefasciatus]|eukprot:XP_001870958.1 26S protease regulatory subunit 6a [Culex quinquefasciatus]